MERETNRSSPSRA